MFGPLSCSRETPVITDYLGCLDCEFFGKVNTVALGIFATICFLITTPIKLAILYSLITFGAIIALRWFFFSPSSTARDLRYCCFFTNRPSTTTYIPLQTFMPYGRPYSPPLYSEPPRAYYPQVSRMNPSTFPRRAVVGEGLSPQRHSSLSGTPTSTRPPIHRSPSDPDSRRRAVHFQGLSGAPVSDSGRVPVGSEE